MIIYVPFHLVGHLLIPELVSVARECNALYWLVPINVVENGTNFPNIFLSSLLFLLLLLFGSYLNFTHSVEIVQMLTNWLVR